MHIRSDVNLWFNKMYVLFIEKDIIADVVVKTVDGWKLVTFCVHQIQRHSTFKCIQYEPKMRSVKTCHSNSHQDVFASNFLLQFIPSLLRTSELNACCILHVGYILTYDLP